MPEFYRKVVATQFTLTDEQKALVLKNGIVDFETQPVRHSSGRFHALINIGERPTPIYEGQWLVRDPDIKIEPDHDFKAKYIKTKDPHE
jgi:hypothetical protein